jgi:trimeric autotransporter adhesin
MVFIGNDLYVTGSFASVGGANVNHIARWTGTSWLNLGSGLSDAGQALATDGTDLYVGGAFTKAGILPSNYFGIGQQLGSGHRAVL